MLLVNHASARVTPAIVILVVLTGSEPQEQLPGRRKFIIFAVFVKTPLFGRQQRHVLPKST